MTLSVLIAIGSLLIPGIFVAYFSYRKAYALAYELTHPRRVDFSFSNYQPFAYKMFEFETEDQLKLTGIDIKPKMDIKGTILVCHYLGGSKISIIPFARPLIQNGFRVVTFDFRNNGESHDDHNIVYAIHKDFRSFYRALKQMGIEGPYGIFGLSMGANVALWALHHHQDIKAAIIDSGPLINVKGYFTYILDLNNVTNPLIRLAFYHLMLHKARFNRMARNTIEILRNLKHKPIFFIHGEKDNIIPITNAELAMRYLPNGNTSFWRVRNSRHLTNRFVKEIEYGQKILSFFSTEIH